MVHGLHLLLGPKRLRKHEDPTNHGFWNTPVSRALKPDSIGSLCSCSFWVSGDHTEGVRLSLLPDGHVVQEVEYAYT